MGLIIKGFGNLFISVVSSNYSQWRREIWRNSVAGPWALLKHDVLHARLTGQLEPGAAAIAKAF